MNVSYWMQVQTMNDRERRSFDRLLISEPDQSAPALSPGAAILAGMMAKGGV